jgi:putative FmdB family regulatory protein
MPTYEYACKSCGEHLEVVQSFKDEPLKECPACGGPLRKVFGSIGIVFKGSGFYRTDSRMPARKDGRDGRDKDGKDKSGKDKDGGKEPAKAESGSTDTKADSGKGSSEASKKDGGSAAKAKGTEKTA